jgi:putative acyl-CoA dehydrogenase
VSPSREPVATHEVQNQPPPLLDFDAFERDPALREALEREGGGFAEPQARSLGREVYAEPVQQWARQANRYVPELCTHDRFGHRIDEVDYHPAYHELMRLGLEAGLHSLPWTHTGRGGHAARAALYYLYNQAENGTACPITMTFAVVPALRSQPDVAAVWEPRVVARAYDSRLVPAEQKTGVTCGMAMTEKQGGSDVRSNTTTAVALGARGSGAEYELTGHKWFCSAPMSDAFLTLAQTERGLSCFLVPRFRPDGERNPFLLQRLKDKLGNRSNASSEIEYRRTWARMIGEEGRGVATIIPMVHHTRLDCVIGSTAITRHALVQALHHTRHRSAFGRLLADQPLMRNVLADLTVESEAMLALMMRLARAFDEGEDEIQRRFARVATAIAKFWVCKRTLAATGEALECLGGAGYVEESPLARLHREAPVNSVWEGSGNVQCLDVLRALSGDELALEALWAEMEVARGADRRFDAYLARLGDELRDPEEFEARARRTVERLALGLQGALLLQHAPSALSDAFCASRLGGDWGQTFGTLPAGLDFGAILERATG